MCDCILEALPGIEEHTALFDFILTPAGCNATTNLLGINYWEYYISTVIVWRSKQSSWHVTHAEKTGDVIIWGQGRISTGLTKSWMFKWNKNKHDHSIKKRGPKETPNQEENNYKGDTLQTVGLPWSEEEGGVFASEKWKSAFLRRQWFVVL